MNGIIETGINEFGISEVQKQVEQDAQLSKEFYVDDSKIGKDGAYEKGERQRCAETFTTLGMKDLWPTFLCTSKRQITFLSKKWHLLLPYN